MTDSVKLKQFTRRAQRVRLGGWRLWRWTVGGRWYTVAPLSALRWDALLTGLRALANAAGVTEDPEDIQDWLNLLGDLAGRKLALLARLLVQEPVRAKDLRRLRREQLISTWAAWVAVHDLDFIRRELTPDGQEDAEDAVSMALVDVAHQMVAEFRGAYDHHQLLTGIPFEEFLAMSALSRRARNIEQGRPPDARPLSQREQAKISQAMAGLGFEVS